MTSGTTPLQSPGFLDALTTAHFVLIAVLAMLTIIGIAYGMKLARVRRQGVRELEDAGHLERIGDASTDDTDTADAAATARASESAAQPTGGDDDAPVVQVVQAPPPPAPEPAMIPRAVPVVAPEPGPAPVAVPTPAAPPVVAAVETDLTRLKGLGPKVAVMLVEQGVPDIATLARLDPAQADAVAAQLGMFAPRMTRDRWVEQAQLLAAGDVAGFEAKFGKL